MSGYYYLDDPKSKSGSSPVSEDDFVRAIFSIAKKHGLEITDEMILEEIYGEEKPVKNLIKRKN